MPNSAAANTLEKVARLQKAEALFTRTPGRNRSAWDQAALRVAWGLYPAARLARTESGSVLLGLSDGGTLALTLSDSSSINGEALWEGAERFAVLNSGAAYALFEFSAALWSDPRLSPGIGETAALGDAIEIRADIPRGLEHAFACGMAKPGIAPPLRPAAWLAEALAELGRSGRLPAFQATLTQSLRMLWLHEIGHVVLSHGPLVSGGRKRAALAEIESLRAYGADASPIASVDENMRRLRHGIEMQADRFAFDRIFARTTEETAIPSFLGAICPPTLLHAIRHLPGRPDEAVEHPPIWFRAVEALRAMHARGLSNGAVSALLRLADLHPVFGDWFGGIAEGVYDVAHAQVEAQALDALAPQSARQRAALLEIAPRPDDQSPLDLMS